MIKIRFARLEDVSSIAALHAASWATTYANMLSPAYLQHTVPADRQAVWSERFNKPLHNQVVLVAEESNEIIGFACFFIREHVELGSYLDNLHVKQSHQGKGIGKSLLAEVAFICEQKCPGLGLYLSVNQANRRAQMFYLALGAHNIHADVWNAPDGSQVPTFRFYWKLAGILAGTRSRARSDDEKRSC